MTRRVTATALAAAGVWCLAVQPSSGVGSLRVSVGDPVMRVSVLRPYTNRWRVSLHGKDGKLLAETAVWTDELTAVRVNGASCFQRTQIATFSKDGAVVGKTETVNVFDAKTMAPVSRTFTRHASVPGQAEETRVQFKGGAVRFHRTLNGKEESSAADLPQAAFDFYGGMYGILIAPLPLREGLRFSLPSVGETAPTLSWVDFTVVGREDVDAGPRGRLKAWLVEADTESGPMKFWITNRAPYIIRLEYTMKDNGLLWTYAMV